MQCAEFSWTSWVKPIQDCAIPVSKMSFEDKILLGVKSVKKIIWTSAYEKDWKCVLKVAKEKKIHQKLKNIVEGGGGLKR